MRHEIGTIVKAEFDAFLKGQHPQFVLDRNAKARPGDRVYRWELGHDLGITAFLLLHISPREDRFTIECAWSRNGEFPSSSQLSRPAPVGEAPRQQGGPENDTIRFRFHALGDPRRDQWWDVDPISPEEMEKRTAKFLETFVLQEMPLEQARARAEDLVRDAGKRVVECAIPYFSALVERR